VAWLIYQKIIAAYADPNRSTGKRAMSTLMESIRRALQDRLEEIAQLGRTLWRRRHDILAFFDHHASNGPTEAINGRLEALRRKRPRIPQPHKLPTAFAPAQRRSPPTLNAL
jgi:transposase